MALEQPGAGWIWWHVPAGAGTHHAVVCGEPHTWWAHWWRRPGSDRAVAVRCTMRELDICEFCGAGYEARPRYVLPLLRDGEPRLVELGAAQYGDLARLERAGEWPGVRVEFWRDGAHRNSPIRLRRIGSVVLAPCDVHDIADLVEDLGRRERRELAAEGVEVGPGASQTVMLFGQRDRRRA